jgi:hypothetical protein
MTTKMNEILANLRARAGKQPASIDLATTTTLAEVKALLERSYCDAEGWFDASKDRERYIKFLELVCEEWHKENAALKAEIAHLEEVIDFSHEHAAGADI